MPDDEARMQTGPGLPIVDRISERVGSWASLLLLPMIGIVIFEVAVRYMFSAPTIWVNELTQIMFGLVFFLCAADTLRTGGHVQVDIVASALPPRASAAMGLWAHLAVFLYLLAFIYILHARILESIAMGETTQTPWNPPIWPSYLAVGVSVLLMMAQAVSLMVGFYRRLSRRPDGPEG